MVGSPDNQRLIGDIIRAGRIASVDTAVRRCTVKIGEMETGPLPWLAWRAGKTRIWSPPSVGEQCLLLCAEGDTNAGFVLPGIYCAAFAPPSTDAHVTLIAFEDDSQIGYDASAHSLTLNLVGAASITAPNGLTIDADVTVNGKVTASDDVVADGKSLKSHTHGGVKTGSDQSGGPA